MNGYLRTGMLPAQLARGKPFYPCFCGLTVLSANLYNAGFLFAGARPATHRQVCFLISTANITMQFGAKPLFENVSAKFGNGNRYGLIGANGCGKSTLMKILGGDLEPSAGQVMLEPNVRLGKLRTHQFASQDC